MKENNFAINEIVSAIGLDEKFVVLSIPDESGDISVKGVDSGITIHRHFSSLRKS